MTLRFFASIDPDGLMEALGRWSAAPGAPGRVDASAGPAPTVMWGRVWALPVAGLDGLAESLARSLPDPPGMARSLPDLPGMARSLPDPRQGPRSRSGFRGHLTLARGRRPADLVGLPVTSVSVAWEVTGVEAVRSRLGAGPARHDVLGRWPLPPVPPAGGGAGSGPAPEAGHRR